MWQLETKTFEKLSNLELYQILKLRQDVFILEQNCLFPEIDNLDFDALHCILKNDSNEVLAYTRLFACDKIYPGYTCIGRVVAAPASRMHGLGRKIFAYSIAEIEKHFGNYTIKIGAQAYLEKFYASFGFEKIGEPYLEDGIWHIYMIKA